MWRPVGRRRRRSWGWRVGDRTEMPPGAVAQARRSGGCSHEGGGLLGQGGVRWCLRRVEVHIAGPCRPEAPGFPYMA